jgi:trehalose/maltose hydrolase-like predicted phosphorylase
LWLPTKKGKNSGKLTATAKNFLFDKADPKLATVEIEITAEDGDVNLKDYTLTMVSEENTAKDGKEAENKDLAKAITIKQNDKKLEEVFVDKKELKKGDKVKATINIENIALHDTIKSELYASNALAEDAFKTALENIKTTATSASGNEDYKKAAAATIISGKIVIGIKKDDKTEPKINIDFARTFESLAK